MDKIIDNLFTTRYEYLHECATNILKQVKRLDLAAELVTDCYFHIKNNKEKLSKQIEDGILEAVVVRWMTMQIRWQNTQFKKTWIYNDNIIINVTQLQAIGKQNNDINDNDSDLFTLKSILLQDETIPEEELLEIEIENQDKLNHIKYNLDNLSLDQRFLFDDFFNRGINTSNKLAKHTGLSRTNCYYIIKQLKANLKNGYKSKII